MPLVLILGLRRSGTTALWRCFQQITDFTGFDEPFNPRLRELPRDHPKGTLPDLLAVADRDLGGFLDRFAPIDASEEGDPTLTARQSAYLSWLVDQASDRNVVIDETRCGFKVRELANTLEPAVVIHLSRTPSAWIQSHMLPSEKGVSYVRQRCRSRLTDLRTRRLPRDYGLDRVGSSASFEGRLVEAGVSIARFNRLKAVEKLYLLWLLHENEIAISGREVWGGRYRQLVYADFVEDPNKHVGEALAAGGIEASPAAVLEACRHVDSYRGVPGKRRGLNQIRTAIADVDRLGLVSLDGSLHAKHGAAAGA